VLDAVSAVRAPNGGASTGEGGLARGAGLSLLPTVLLFLLGAAALAVHRRLRAV